ncbi:MAG TPA: DUF5689 domain-containing protein [Tenuifilaceae bacterium]|nr:DUF5689 domain-containing protein [Tenuifilaceae bacterium]
MIKKILAILVPIAMVGLIALQNGCVKEDFDTVPPLRKAISWKGTATIADVKGFFNGPNNPSRTAGLIKKLVPASYWEQLAANGVGDSSIIIDGLVISCDSAANFYETVTIMDSTGGIDFKINASDLYLTYGFKPGKRVLVKLNDLAIDSYHGVYQIGLPYTDAGTLKVTGVDPSMVAACTQMSGEQANLTPLSVDIGTITAGYVQKLIVIDSVQFWNPEATYSLPGVNTNRTLVDTKGNQIVLRNSGYSKFVNDKVPSGSGYIVGVLGIYDGTYQLTIRDPRDIQFNNPRFGSQPPAKNATIADLKAACTSNLVKITQDLVVEAVVLANDKSGNIYKSLFIEDESGAIEFKIDVYDLFVDFPVGTKIAISCKDMYVGKYGGVVQLGGVYNDAIGMISANEFYQKVFVVGSGFEVTPIPVNINELTADLVGKLVTISDVQYIDSELGKTYAESSITNRHVEDALGRTAIVRTSNYADFAGIILPSKRGSITAVLSKYYNDYQLYIRDLSDVWMTQPRRVKNYILKQDFSSATANSPISVGGWQSIAEVGTRRWMAKVYSGNTYAEMNPYQSGEASNIGWLISPAIPVASGVTTYLTFNTQFAYWANSTLEVFVSENYDGANPASATWTKLSNAHIVTQSEGQNTWVSSGLVDISEFPGTIYLGFKYSGGGSIGQTTAFRVDDVNVFTQQ